MYDTNPDESLVKREPRRKQNHWVRYVSYIFLIILSLTLVYVWLSPGENQQNNDDWDFLLFTQAYPISACIWVREDSKTNVTCNFASNKYVWTVHGIWPTKTGEMGPFFCQNVPFNQTALEPILPDLEEHWLSIKSNEDSKFWKHEWRKHGTCAVEDSVFDSELTYFQLGLQWNAKYNVTDMLNGKGIVPSDSRNYSYSDFLDSVKSELGVAPVIACYLDEARKVYIIQEIRLCVSKTLELLDCDKYFIPEKKCMEHDIYYPLTTDFSSA